MASWSKDWFPSAIFAGSLLPIVGLQLIALCLLIGLDLPPLSIVEQQHQGRSIFEVMQQPVFVVAVLTSMMGYGIMVLLMTATPLAMMAIHHPFHTAASTIQWHILGMFTPSFFTRFLIAHCGVLNIIGDLMNDLFHQLSMALEQVSPTTEYLVDSFPV